MSVNPVTITTEHDSPLFDPEDHRKQAAEQLGLDPDAIQCIACGPDTFDRISEATYSQDGTLLKAAVIAYHRKTTWEPRPTVIRAKEVPPVIPKENHAQPRLPRGARWHGVVDGVEGNYISDGAFLHHVDSDPAKALVKDMAAESGSGTVAVGK